MYATLETCAPVEGTTNDEVFDFAKEDPASDATESKCRSFIQGEWAFVTFRTKNAAYVVKIVQTKETTVSQALLNAQNRQQSEKISR